MTGTERAEASVTLAQIERADDPDLDALARLIAATFPDPNVVLDPSHLRALVAADHPGAARRIHVVVASAASVVVGGVVFSYVARSNCGFSEYLVSAPQHRGRGLGGRLVWRRREILDADARAAGTAGCRGVFIEVENPERTPREVVEAESVTALDPAERWRLFDHLGFGRLDLRYRQPPLDPGKDAVDYLDLLFAPWDEAVLGSSRVPAEWIFDTLEPIWAGWAPRASVAMLAALRGEIGRDVRLLPLHPVRPAAA